MEVFLKGGGDAEPADRPDFAVPREEGAANPQIGWKDSKPTRGGECQFGVR